MRRTMLVDANTLLCKFLCYCGIKTRCFLGELASGLKVEQVCPQVNNMFMI